MRTGVAYGLPRVVRGGGEPMLYLWNANLEKGRDKEFQRWVAKNIETYKKHAVKGLNLVGVYGTSMSFGRYDVTWIWELDSYRRLDDAFDQDDPVLNRLVKQEFDFYVPGSMRATMLRAVKDWRIP
jgi:hypothetical protein